MTVEGELRLLMVAAPGGGKGTQGERLAAKFGIQHVSSGEVLRAEASAGTPAASSVPCHVSRSTLAGRAAAVDGLADRKLARSCAPRPG